MEDEKEQSMRLSDIIPASQIISPRTHNEIIRSPQLAAKKLQHMIDIDDEKLRIKKDMIENELENKINSCCSGTSDKRLLVFISQMAITILILLFCFVQIARGSDNQEFYFSLVSLILGLYLPSPTTAVKK